MGDVKELAQWMKDFGISFVILAVLSGFFKFSIWPLVVKWFEEMERQKEVALQFLKEQIKERQEQVLRSESRNQKICDDFTCAMTKLADGQKVLIEEFKNLARKVETKK
jgi:hypothetical protein